jgi:hypothetical protein
MTSYLALIFFCAGAKCGLIANTQVPYPNLESCQTELKVMVMEMNRAEIEFVYPACVPLKFMRIVQYGGNN